MSTAALTPFRPLPQRADAPEWLELPDQDAQLVRGSLADLRRLNRWLGGVRLTLWALDRLTLDCPHASKITLLDVATGGADIPRAVAAWAERRGWHARLIVTDLSPTILRPATRGPDAPTRRAVADARRLPLADASVDIAMCSLVLHHLSPEEAILMLREMGRVARRGVVVNDLVRGWPSLLGAHLLGRVATRNPITRHDAIVSVRRAYTPAEMAALAALAGLGHVTFGSWWGYRVVMLAGVLS